MSKTKKKLHYTRGYCPIPQEQRILSLYNKLADSTLHNLIIQAPIKVFQTKTLAICIYIYIVKLASTVNFYQNVHFFETFLQSIYMSFSIVCILHLILIKEWNDFKIKTKKSLVIYEETGLLESQVWKKPIITLIQDFLIQNYKINPILRKLNYQLMIYTSIAVFLLICLSFS